jgi:ligand-binding sensor domain-containing protein
MSKTQFRYLMVCALFIFCYVARSQEYSPFETDISHSKSTVLKKNLPAKGFTRKSGNVYCSLKDRNGNLWFGTTEDGLYRFDGTHFLNFLIPDGLPSNTINTIIEDAKGLIWIGTNSGLCTYDGSSFKQQPIIIAGHPINDTCVYKLFQDSKGLIWIGLNTGLYIYQNGRYTAFLGDSLVNNPTRLELKNIACILEDHLSNMWFGSGMGGGEGLTVYDGKLLTNHRPNKDVWIVSMLVDDKGSVWVSGRSHGYFRFDGKKFTDFSETNEFSLVESKNSHANCLNNELGFGPLIQDEAGEIWLTGKMKRFGGKGGLCRFKDGVCELISLSELPDGEAIWSLIEDGNGAVWIGTTNTGLYRLQDGHLKCFSEK